MIFKSRTAYELARRDLIARLAAARRAGDDELAIAISQEGQRLKLAWRKAPRCRDCNCRISGASGTGQRCKPCHQARSWKHRFLPLAAALQAACIILLFCGCSSIPHPASRIPHPASRIAAAIPHPASRIAALPPPLPPGSDTLRASSALVLPPPVGLITNRISFLFDPNPSGLPLTAFIDLRTLPETNWTRILQTNYPPAGGRLSASYAAPPNTFNECRAGFAFLP